MTNKKRREGQIGEDAGRERRGAEEGKRCVCVCVSKSENIQTRNR